jgi:NADH-quinone oxidoreductase subunit G
VLAALADGSHPFAAVLKAAKNPMVIVGAWRRCARDDGAAVLAASGAVARRWARCRAEWHGFNVLHTAAARVGGLDLGLVPGKGGKSVAGMLGGGVDVLMAARADEIDTAADRGQYVRGLSGPPR